LALARSELTGWSMRRKSGTAPSSFVVAMLLPLLGYKGGAFYSPTAAGSRATASSP
jgi:hypothetical protein